MRLRIMRIQPNHADIPHIRTYSGDAHIRMTKGKNIEGPKSGFLDPRYLFSLYMRNMRMFKRNYALLDAHKKHPLGQP